MTEREHNYSADEWATWWTWVREDYVPPRERRNNEQLNFVRSEQVRTLVKQLAVDEVPAREKLIALGNSSVPHLLDCLKDELSEPTPIKSEEPANATPIAIRLAWVIDELDETDQIPAETRLAYFKNRFSRQKSGLIRERPIESEAAARAFQFCSIKDICELCIAEESVFRWYSHYNTVIRDFIDAQDADRDRIVATRFANSIRTHLKKVAPARENIAAQISESVPVLVQALDGNEHSRERALAFTAMIARNFPKSSEDFVQPLAERWRSTEDADFRQQIVRTIGDFRSEKMLSVISGGLSSQDVDIAFDALELVDHCRIAHTAETDELFQKIKLLTRHEHSGLRIRAVICLRSKSSQLLLEEVERLINDQFESIRRDCAAVIRTSKVNSHHELLFKLVDDPDEVVRSEAFTSISQVRKPEWTARLIPYVKNQVTAQAASTALAVIAGRESLPILMDELRAGRELGDVVYDRIRQVSTKNFPSKPDPWTDWWLNAPENRELQFSAFKPLECEIFEVETNKPVDESGFSIVFRFYKPATDGTSELNVARYSLTDSPSTFRFHVPPFALKHEDRDLLRVQLILKHPKYELKSHAESVPLLGIIQNNPLGCRDAFRKIEVRNKR
jgi:HEAT repeat protein